MRKEAQQIYDGASVKNQAQFYSVSGPDFTCLLPEKALSFIEGGMVPTRDCFAFLRFHPFSFTREPASSPAPGYIG